MKTEYIYGVWAGKSRIDFRRESALSLPTVIALAENCDWPVWEQIGTERLIWPSVDSDRQTRSPALQLCDYGKVISLSSWVTFGKLYHRSASFSSSVKMEKNSIFLIKLL